MPPRPRKQAKTTTSIAPVPSTAQLPDPFVKPDGGIESFLEYFDTEHVYITHIDRTQRLLKRNTFIQVFVLNVIILALLIWRAVYIGPYYGALVLTFLGRDSPLSVDTERTPLPELINAVFNRTGVLFFDFLIFRVLGSWPWSFFIGQTTPAFWRSGIGFKDVEIVIRRSRLWDTRLPKNWLWEQERGDGKEVFDERIMPAIHKDYVRRKTGYLMMDKSWDLDYAAMVMAHHVVDTRKNKLSDFEKTVIVHHETHGWLIWPVWKLDEGADDEQRQKLVIFKDTLTKMGKENLFFRWIELIQFESSQPGGFTPDRQQKAMKQAKELFESQGVDFEKFWEEVGGVQGLPGWDA